MDLKNQIIQEYLNSGMSYRQLELKYGIAKSIICRWIKIYQGIHNLQPTEVQCKHYIDPMARKNKTGEQPSVENEAALQQRITELEKQLAHQELRAEILDTLINVAEKQLNINIRKKPGTQQSKK